jgi:hypothetical protein
MKPEIFEKKIEWIDNFIDDLETIIDQ